MWRHKIWFKNNSKICCNNTHSPEPYYFPIPLKDSCLSLGIGATSVWEREREREIGRARGRVCTCSWTMVCKVRWTSLAIPLASPQTYKYAPCETRLQKCAACTWTRIVDAVRKICYTSQTAILLVSYHYLPGPSSYVEHTPFVDPPVKMQQSTLRAHLVPQNCLAHPHK